MPTTPDSTAGKVNLWPGDKEAGRTGSQLLPLIRSGSKSQSKWEQRSCSLGINFFLTSSSGKEKVWVKERGQWNKSDHEWTEQKINPREATTYWQGIKAKERAEKCPYGDRIIEIRLLQLLSLRLYCSGRLDILTHKMSRLPPCWPMGERTNVQ